MPYSPPPSSGAISTVAGKTGVVTLVKADVGLSNVDNTSDTSKPVSSAVQTALDAKSDTSHNHDATYEAKNTNIQTHIASAHAPSSAQKNSDITKSEIEAKLTGEITSHTHPAGSGAAWGGITGTMANQTDLQAALNAKANSLGSDDNYVTDAEKTKLSNLSGTNTGDQDLSALAPKASPTFTGTVSGVTKAMVGLGNADNTSDANKPVSNATQAALDGKAASNHNHDGAYAVSGHTHVNDHTRQHSITSASDHTFPGGTTNFLREDGTFATPPAGNDARLTVARKTAAQAITGAATNVTDMALTLAAASTYQVYITVPVTTSTGTSPTLAFSFTGPATPTLVSLRRTQMTSATAVASSVLTSFGAFAAGASVANTHHTIEGIVVTSAGNGGTLQLRAAAAGTTPSITIPAGASMYAIKTA